MSTDLASLLAEHGGVSFDLTTPREYTKHGGWLTTCTCGELLCSHPDDCDCHAAHLASVIEASEWLAAHTQALGAEVANALEITRLATESETGWRREAEELAAEVRRLHESHEALIRERNTWARQMADLRGAKEDAEQRADKAEVARRDVEVSYDTLRINLDDLADEWDAMRARNGRPMLTTANVVDRLRALLGGES